MRYDNNLFRTAQAVCQTGDAAENAIAAARKIRDDFKAFPTSVVVFFASVAYDPGVLAREMQDAFPQAVTMGCTSAGEGVDDAMPSSSVVAMAFAGDVFDHCETALVLEDAGGKDGGDIFTSAPDAMLHLGRNLGVPLLDLDYKQYVGLVLIDRFAVFNERVIEQIGEKTNVFFAGGAAGDDYKFAGEQRVFYRGGAYANAAVMALWKPRNGFELLKTQAVDITGPSMLITRADEEARIVWELDGEDALAAYARAIGRPAEEIGFPDLCEHPLALIVEGKPFLRSTTNPVGGKGLQLASLVREGTRLSVTRAEDILAVTEKDLDDKRRDMDTISGTLHINCAGRRAALAGRNRLEEFGLLFSGVPSVSFASYGEVYVDLIAFTSVMILFK